MELLTGVQWGQFGPPSLLALVVVCVIRGDLVPRRTYEAMVKDRDWWRSKFEEQQQVNADLADSVKTSARVLEALPHIERIERGES